MSNKRRQPEAHRLVMPAGDSSLICQAFIALNFLFRLWLTIKIAR